jgi:hypothetical protein
MTRVRDTKGAVLYNEIEKGSRRSLPPNDPDAKIGTLYIRKAAFSDTNFPTDITVTVEESAGKK